jgi:hypothetical protein
MGAIEILSSNLKYAPRAKVLAYYAGLGPSTSPPYNEGDTMRLELKMKIHTPHGKANKMIIKDGEVLFVMEEIKKAIENV